MTNNTLKLGTQTGSVMNHLYNWAADAAPAVGMGATQLMWTDRHAFTVVEVISPAKVVLQQDKATRVDKLGMTDSGQQYEFSPNPDAPKVTVTLRKNGRWVAQGDSMNGTAYKLGHRDEYHDFSF